jgi:hypothetical protein
VARYRDALEDDRTFETRTLERLLDAHALTDELEITFRERYLWVTEVDAFPGKCYRSKGTVCLGVRVHRCRDDYRIGHSRSARAQGIDVWAPRAFAL